MINSSSVKSIHIKEISKSIKEVFNKKKEALTMQEIKEVVSDTNRTIIRLMVRTGILKKSPHYMHNSTKTFIHPKSKKQEEIKGTRYYKYSINN